MLSTVWPLYIALFLLLSRYGTLPEESLFRRVKKLLLGLCCLCFGTGRLLWWANPADLPHYNWIFDLGHWALASFGLAYVFAAEFYRKHGEWP